MPGNVRSILNDAVDVVTLTAAAEDQPLTAAERVVLVDQSLVLIESFYAHLPLKRAMHAVDPVQRLRLLQLRSAEMETDYEFHNEMTAIFNSVRDLHTNYILPTPYANMVAFLPFEVEAYWENGTRRYLVSHVVSGFEHDTLVPGVEVTHWNGAPIERAVRRAAMTHAGSNMAARHARGVAGLTIRPLVRSLPPDEEWVQVEYRTDEGEALEERVDWFLVGLPPDPGGGPEEGANRANIGMDLDADNRRRASKLLHAPLAFKAEQQVADKGLSWEDADWPASDWPESEWPKCDWPKSTWPGRASAGRGKKGRRALRTNTAAGGVPSLMPSVFNAQAVDTTSGTFGHIRIRTFSVPNANQFVVEFVRLAGLLPQNGLIVDVRDNGGGLITAGEQLLQTLTPKTIEPERMQFINSPLTLKLCQLHRSSQHLQDFDLGPWIDSIEEAIRTGATYSRGFPITSSEAANRIGQRYHGPTVLITNARCYSTTDIFAAGYQDHEIGFILGTDANTGAGGANVWEHDLLDFLFTRNDPPRRRLEVSPFRSLPRNAGIRVAIRRTMRSGPNAGTPLEDLGVKPNDVHNMTRDDLLAGNADLLNRAGEILMQRQIRAYRLTVSPGAVSGGNWTLSVTTENLSRLDLYLNDRPIRSVDISNGANAVDIPVPTAPAVLDLKGFQGGKLAAARRLFLPAP